MESLLQLVSAFAAATVDNDALGAVAVGCVALGACCTKYILGAVVLSYTVAVAVFASTGKMLLPVKSVVFSHLSEPFS